MFPVGRRPKLSWELPVSLDRNSPARPLFLQVAATIAGEICRGRLRPGDHLPGTRTLARSLGVNRITILTAYDELVAEGWIVIRPASGARVADDLPEAVTRCRIPVGCRRGPNGQTGYELALTPTADYSP